ncbi:hypothetical protein L1987_64252 [Smallanthus sonchifolius]|uniref:Uncharacterized protein n=1 Tax=Smallanthus sonchifolius TaxID=185202 RepID=A0ACB9CFG3_9ASTR|nr:hypothetical protein L1987_64252 [Smallanthus sonchifolius]
MSKRSAAKTGSFAFLVVEGVAGRATVVVGFEVTFEAIVDSKTLVTPRGIVITLNTKEIHHGFVVVVKILTNVSSSG